MELKRGSQTRAQKAEGLAEQYAATGNLDGLRVLLAAGVKPDSLTKNGKTLATVAAEYAAKTGDGRAILMMVSYGANIALKDKNGKSAMGVLSGRPEILEEVRKEWMEKPLVSLRPVRRKLKEKKEEAAKGEVGGRHGIARTLDILQRVSLHSTITSLGCPKELDTKNRKDEALERTEERRRNKAEFDIRDR